MKSLKRDHHNTNHGCASPMLLRTGLGSNSSTGSPKQAPLGKRPTLTAAVSDFLGHIRDSIGPDPSNGKFLTVIVWPQDSWDTPLGQGGRASPLVTKTLLFFGEGGNDGVAGLPPGGGGKMFRAYDKASGKVLWEMELPAGTTGAPMTYMQNGKQYIVVATGWKDTPGELIALALP